MIEHNMREEYNHYHKILKDKKHGEIGRNYLYSRGINDEAIDKWKIGWAPYGMKPNGFKYWTGSFNIWEKMYGRITFPIFDQNGEVVSISGRLVLKINRPKYDHYPFQARKILFGLYQNKENIRQADRLIITEGQLDVISAWARGVNIVASSFGAHCSIDHFAIASRYASNIDVLYDNDNAGKMGMEAIKKFSTWGDLNIKLRYNIFKNGMDLDEWIRCHSKEELFEILHRNKTDYLREKLKMLR